MEDTRKYIAHFTEVAKADGGPGWFMTCYLAAIALTVQQHRGVPTIPPGWRFLVFLTGPQVNYTLFNAGFVGPMHDCAIDSTSRFTRIEQPLPLFGTVFSPGLMFMAVCVTVQFGADDIRFEDPIV